MAIYVIGDGVKEGLRVLVIEYESVLVRTGIKIEIRFNFHGR